jgi:transglutaminase-like putative cysteine protease
VSAPDATRRQLRAVAEISLAAMTLAAVVGLRRLFKDSSFLPPVLISAVAAHAVAAGCRRAKLGHAPALLLGWLAAVLVITWTQLGETALGGIVPTSDTLHQARFEIEAAWRTFGQVTAPAPVLPGFVLASSLGAWIVAFSADTAAFRARANVEAVIPSATLFVFGGALGAGSGRLPVAALFLASALVHWLSQRSLAMASAPTWLSTGTAGTRPLLRAGVVLAAVGVVAAVVVGPHLPGASAGAVVPWRASDREEPGSRVTISPLVDIRTRLVEQSQSVAFTVRSDRRSYWRLTSLERFDGRIWSSNREYRPAEGELDAGIDLDENTTTVVAQHFTISSLASIWLPAAFRPLHVDGANARYDDDSNSLLVDGTPVGLTYTVLSAVPSFTAEQLRDVPPVAPRSIAETYTALPRGFSPAVRQEAARIVAGARTQYDKARRLQDHLRGGSFTYDLEVDAGHDADALERFLFDTRRGYCEQFAGAFAAMARAVGLPARVAVGFTTGELDAATGEYVVRGSNGHAWPEVYLDGAGWVAFEPTPGRGAPGAQSYTDVPESQAAIDDPSVATTVPITPTTAAPQGPTTTTTAVAPAGEVPLPEDERAATSWPRRVLQVLVAVLLAGLTWIGALALALRWRRRARHRRAATPAQRVLVAWDEVAEALARAGTPAQAWETPNEFARRAAGATGVDPRLLAGLAGLMTTVSYSNAGVSESAAEQAAQAAAAVKEAAEARVDRRTRLRSLVDPRPLLPDRAARVQVTESRRA